MNYGMKLNKNKTKVMLCSELDKKKQLNINNNSEPIKQVQNYSYYGGKITKDSESKSRRIINRIAWGKSAFQNKNYLLTTNEIWDMILTHFFENVRMECMTFDTNVTSPDSQRDREEKTRSVRKKCGVWNHKTLKISLCDRVAQMNRC